MAYVDMLMRSRQWSECAKAIDSVDLFTLKAFKSSSTGEAPVASSSLSGTVACEEWTLMHVAAQTEAPLEIISKLVKKGFDVDEQSEEGQGTTPLHIACSNGSLATVQALVECGANVGKAQHNGMAALHLMALASAFSASSAPPLMATLSRSPGAASAMSGGNAPCSRLELVEWLLQQKGANVNQPDEKGVTPFHLSCWYNDNDMTRLFMLNNADLDMKAQDQETALLGALRRRHYPLVLELIDGGADLAAQDQRGLTALHLACKNNAYQIARRLLIRGAPLTKPDEIVNAIATSGAMNVWGSDALPVIQTLLSDGLDPFLPSPVGFCVLCQFALKKLTNANQHGDTLFDVLRWKLEDDEMFITMFCLKNGASPASFKKAKAKMTSSLARVYVDRVVFLTTVLGAHDKRVGAKSPLRNLPIRVISRWADLVHCLFPDEIPSIADEDEDDLDDEDLDDEDLDDEDLDDEDLDDEDLDDEDLDDEDLDDEEEE